MQRSGKTSLTRPTCYRRTLAQVIERGYPSIRMTANGLARPCSAPRHGHPNAWHIGLELANVALTQRDLHRSLLGVREKSLIRKCSVNPRSSPEITKNRHFRVRVGLRQLTHAARPAPALGSSKQSLVAASPPAEKATTPLDHDGALFQFPRNPELKSSTWLGRTTTSITKRTSLVDALGWDSRRSVRITKSVISASSSKRQKRGSMSAF